MRKGLTQDFVVKAAAELIERKGRCEFSMHSLADSLGVKTASLYNHVESMDTLLTEVCRYALRLQENLELSAIEGKTREESVYALADAYRKFAKEHRELYWLIMNTAAENSRVLDDAAECFTEPLVKMLQGFVLPEVEKVHFRRFFRAIVHGFISQEESGFFSHYPAAVDESFHFAIQHYIDSLKNAEKRYYN